MWGGCGAACQGEGVSLTTSEVPVPEEGCRNGGTPVPLADWAAGADLPGPVGAGYVNRRVVRVLPFPLLRHTGAHAFALPLSASSALPAHQRAHRKELPPYHGTPLSRPSVRAPAAVVAVHDHQRRALHCAAHVIAEILPRTMQGVHRLPHPAPYGSIVGPVSTTVATQCTLRGKARVSSTAAV
jgi:hypothetical protein